MESKRSVFDHRILCCGDIHGHFLLALTAAALWQKREGFSWDAILLAGDLGTFTDELVLDKATRRMARDNPCEVEFPRLWLQTPIHPLIDAVFSKTSLGLDCPIIGVHGNHEGFERLSEIVPQRFNAKVEEPSNLPAIDPHGKIRLLPSGWTVRLPCGVLVTGFGGIESRKKENVHPMYSVDESAIEAFLTSGTRTDILLTHEGPRIAFQQGGSPLLEWVARERVDGLFVHGHHVERKPFPLNPATGRPLVLGLEGIAFQGKNSAPVNGWAKIEYNPESRSFNATLGAPDFIAQQLSRRRWLMTNEGILVPPQLHEAAWTAGIGLAKET